MANSQSDKTAPLPATESGGVPPPEGEGVSNTPTPIGDSRLATGSPAGSLPGDIDGDGDVDMADVTAALATGQFAKVTEVLANFGAREFRLTIDPGSDVRVEAVFSQAGLRYETGTGGECTLIGSSQSAHDPWSNDLVPRELTQRGLVIQNRRLGQESLGLVPKVDEPRTGTPKDQRWLQLQLCDIQGDGLGGSVPVADIKEWGGGVYLHSCMFRGTRACVPNAAAHVQGFANNLTSDFCSNARAVVGCGVFGIRPPVDSGFHPDLWQQSWGAGSKIGPLLIDGLRGRGIHAQAFFINSPDVVIPAVYVRDYDVECTPDNGYKAQIRSPIGLLVFDGFRLINQDLSILVKRDANGQPVKTIGTCVVRRWFKVITKQGIDASQAVLNALKLISSNFRDER